jgi:plastocyanin
MKSRLPFCGYFFLLLICSSFSFSQQITVTASVALMSHGKRAKARDASNVVVWLTPAEGTELPAELAPPSRPQTRLVQHNKSFEPHVLVVHVGSQVEFPNHDPFFHNVFSLFDGKRFDLGLYEAGSTRDVLFDKPGISYIFCNIHAEMSGVVIALNTPYYGISDREGQIVIPRVPPGRYTSHVWYETAMPETLNAFTRGVAISESTSTLGILRLPEPRPQEAHKNMYGHDYPPPAPGSPAYQHP